VNAVGVLIGIALLWIMISKVLAVSLRHDDPASRPPGVSSVSNFAHLAGWQDVPTNRQVEAFPFMAGRQEASN
jgi:hypothetical protein